MDQAISPESEDKFPRSETAYRELATFAMSLSSPLRLKIIDLLSQQDLAVQDLVVELGASQPLVSQHLRVLRNVGIVVSIRSGRQRVYHLQSAAMQGIINLLEPVAEQAHELINAQKNSSEN